MTEGVLTLFSIPKPFADDIRLIQQNAIRSWVRLRPEVDIILMGNEVGVREVSEAFEIEHVPELPRTRLGTPLLDEAFRIAQEKARGDYVGYINADIILTRDFVRAFRSIPFRDFLAIGNRWNIDLQREIDPHHPEYEDELRRLVEADGELQPPRGSDYFIFRKETLGEMPPFAVGRPAWDNWLIYHARSRKLPVIDLSPDVLVIHQNHDYGHVPDRRGRGWEGPEADANRQLIGGWEKVFTLHHATHVLEEGRVRRALHRPYLRQRMLSSPVLYPWLRPLALTVNILLVMGRRLGLRRGES